MFAAYIKNRKKGLITIINLIITLSLYLNIGFRYKLIFLLLPIFLFYFIVSNVRPNLYFLYFTIGILVISLSNSIIELTRLYGRGLNLQNLKNLNLLDIFVNIFTLAESSVFLITSGIMSIIPSKVSYVYFYPLLNVIKHPIPSAFIKNKNSADYLENALLVLFQNNKSQIVGAAIHNYGEYFLMFGWMGIIIGGYFLGIILKKLWIWILIHEDEDIALPLYLLNISYLFIVISRGYLPMQFLLYAYSVLPLNLIYIFNRRKIITNYT